MNMSKGRGERGGENSSSKPEKYPTYRLVLYSVSLTLISLAILTYPTHLHIAFEAGFIILAFVLIATYHDPRFLFLAIGASVVGYYIVLTHGVDFSYGIPVNFAIITSALAAGIILAGAIKYRMGC